MAHVLIVDDDANTREAIALAVARTGHTVAQAGDLREARIQLIRQQPAAILVDLNLPDGKGFDLLDDIDNRAATAVVLISGNATVDSAIDALRLGAADYLVKPVDYERLQGVLAKNTRTASGSNGAVGRLPQEEAGFFGLMLGRSVVMQSLYREIGRVAPTEATVLLVGESGTGKDLAAQTVHAMSRRAERPFLAVNCGAISPNLIESEMFGHERGSFTGADRQHRGYFERANGGTLFLDEITEMPPELQVKLLRVLETGRFMRIGTEREIGTNVRVIAATNRDPEAAVAAGTLRADLFHRLNVFPLQMPPLRDRVGDVELLAAHFLAELNERHGTDKRFGEETLAGIAAHDWPGNARELRNFVHRTYILGERTTVASLSPNASATAAGSTAHAQSVEIRVGASMAEAEKQLILATYAKFGGVRKHVAQQLGISAKTLYSRLQEYGVGSDDADDP